MRLSVIIITTLLLTAAFFYMNTVANSIPLELSNNSYISHLLKYQFLILLLSICALVITISILPQSKSMLSIGRLHSLPKKEVWLGINGKSNWLSNGLQLLFFVSMVTGITLYLNLKPTGIDLVALIQFIPIILVIALINSFSEEIIYRFIIIGGLKGYAPKLMILLLSAILFGLPHFFGYPPGPTGVIIASMLGYILAKSTYETNGIGIAWGIHFVQDVIIFSFLFLMNLKT